MNIALDIDGVIIDFVTSFISTLKEKHGFSLSYQEIFCHNISQVLALPKEDVNNLLSETLDRNNFQLIAGAKESIEFLNEHHNVYLITGRDPQFKRQTEELLAKQDIQYKSLYFSEYLKKHETDIEFDFFVEDSVEEAVSLSQKVDQVLLFNHPWNEKCLNIKNLFKRVYSWGEVLKEIEIKSQFFSSNSVSK